MDMMELMQSNEAEVGAAGVFMGGLFLLIELALIGLMLAGLWKVFAKAGKPGWAAIVPIYNVIVLIEITGRPIWWVALWIFPCTTIFPLIVCSIDVAKRFGQGTGFAIGLILLPFIFYPMLGFGSAEYTPA